MKRVLLLFVPALAAAETCHEIDLPRSEIRFFADQAGMTISGRFREFGGEACLDGGGIVRLDSWIAPASVDTGFAEADATLQGPEFFASDDHPQARFSGDGVFRDDGEQVALGQLVIKGIAREQRIPFVFDGREHLQGEFVLDRLAFDIGTGEWADTEWLDDEVRVRFEIYLKTD